MSFLGASKGSSNFRIQSSKLGKRGVSNIAQDGRPFRMAVVGSGPAGFYTAYKVMSNIRSARIDMYEFLPVPFGLVRFGVAPDHPEVKVGRSETKVATFHQVMQVVLMFFESLAMSVWDLMRHLLRIVRTNLQKLRRPLDSSLSATLRLARTCHWRFWKQITMPFFLPTERLEIVSLGSLERIRS